MSDSGDVTEAWRALVYAHDRLIRIFEAHLQEQHGLSKPQFDVLRRLLDADDNRTRMQDLAQSLFYSSGSATRVIDRLVESGLVERGADENDRRVVYVCLTPAGFELARKAVDAHRALVREVMTPFASSAEAKHVVGYLQRLAEGLTASDG